MWEAFLKLGESCGIRERGCGVQGTNCSYTTALIPGSRPFNGLNLTNLKLSLKQFLERLRSESNWARLRAEGAPFGKKIDFRFLFLNERFVYKEHEFQVPQAYLTLFPSYKFFFMNLYRCNRFSEVKRKDD